MNRHVSPSSSTIRILGIYGLRCQRRRQLNSEKRFAARITGRHDRSAVTRDDVVRNAQAQARAVARGLGGDPRIKNARQQFVWNFRYPGADGKFGGSRPELYNDEDNAATARPGPLGIDPKDPLGLDDLVSVGLMVVPVNRPVKLILRAKDVTHSFFVPALRFKQDAVPGLRINVHFTPIREGRYEIACAELCGISHHRMRAFLEVRSQSEFEKWLQEKASQ